MSLQSEVIRILNNWLATAKKITQLTALPSPVTTGDLFEVVRGGVNYKADGSQLPSGGGGGTTEHVTKNANFIVSTADTRKTYVIDSASSVTAQLPDLSAEVVDYEWGLIYVGAGGGDIDANGQPAVSSNGTDFNFIGPDVQMYLYYDSEAGEYRFQNGTAGGGGGTVETVVGSTFVDVDSTDPANPVVSLDATGTPSNQSYLRGDNTWAIPSAINITATPAGPLAGTNVQQQLNELAGFISGLAWKDSVRVATTVAGTLASDFSNGDTVDGVVLATGDRILIKNQASQTENGIYRVNSGGAPTRTADADQDTDLQNATVSVDEGTSNANTTWVQTTDNVNIGVSNIVFTQFGSSVADASESTKGIAEIATQAEVDAWTDDTRIVTPLKLASATLSEFTLVYSLRNTFNY